ncbi:FAD-dependent monooxygenase [Dactylosporangium sp. CA-152071]|uniref:FAD-dependent monooxygenase n=1 Tax=Dactylosporangium sp. CA-152071 TaxID=3239933 RepID=UPI003D8DB0FA
MTRDAVGWPHRACTEVRQRADLPTMAATQIGTAAGVSMRNGQSRRFTVVGGGPAGLFLARMVGMTVPGAHVDVYERSTADDNPGFGVALSDRSLAGIAAHDPQTHERIMRSAVTLNGVQVRLPDTVMRYDGFAMATISRRILLDILREQAQHAGARLHFQHTVNPADLHPQSGHDLLVIADGAASRLRAARAAEFGTTVRRGRARYIWLGSHVQLGDVATFAFAATPFGAVAAHAYPFGEGMSTVVIEMDDAVWRDSGFGPKDGADDAAVPIGQAELDALSTMFEAHLRGQPLISRNNRWHRFAVVQNERWSSGGTVLIGDAAHTAHFTIGSGTKLAMYDAIALAAALREHDDTTTALHVYEQRRRGPVERVQRRASASMRWWETFGRRMHLPAAQFGLHFLTRAAGFSYADLRDRCGEQVAKAESALRRSGGAPSDARPSGTSDTPDAIDAPLRRGTLRLANRRVSTSPDDAVAGLVLLREDDGRARAGAHAVLRQLPDRRCDVDPIVGSVEFVDVHCPANAEPSGAADLLVAQAGGFAAQGFAGVLLRGPNWQQTLVCAGRIREETGLLVAVAVPEDWAADRPYEPAVEPWPDRVRLALVTGRADLIVAWPGYTESGVA